MRTHLFCYVVLWIFGNAASCVHQSGVKQQFHYYTSLPRLHPARPLSLWPPGKHRSAQHLCSGASSKMSNEWNQIMWSLFGLAPLTRKYAVKAHPFVDGLKAYSFFLGGFKTKQMHWPHSQWFWLNWSGVGLRYWHGSRGLLLPHLHLSPKHMNKGEPLCTQKHPYVYTNLLVTIKKCYFFKSRYWSWKEDDRRQ